MLTPVGHTVPLINTDIATIDQSSTMLLSVMLAKAAMVNLQQDQRVWQQRAKTLSFTDATRFTQHLQSMSCDVLSMLLTMSLLTNSPIRLKEQIKTIREQLQESVEYAFKTTATYQTMRKEVHNELDAANAKINASQLEFSAFNRLPTATEQPQVDSFATVRDLLVGKASENVHHHVGKRTGHVFDVIHAFVTKEASEDSVNPQRDKMIEATVEVSTAGLAAKVQPRLIWAYLVSEAGKLARAARPGVDVLANNEDIAYLHDQQWIMSGGEGLSYAGTIACARGAMDVAEACGNAVDKTIQHMTDLPENMERLAQNQNAAYWWNRQWQLSGGEGPMFAGAVSEGRMLLKAAALPFEAVNKVTEIAATSLRALSDAIDLTDENLGKMACSSRAFISDHSPLDIKCAATKRPSKNFSTSLETNEKQPGIK